jgi:hypothetical protein
MDLKALFDKIRSKQLTYNEFKNLTLPYLKKEPHCFWAGLEGKKRAQSEKSLVSDDQVVIIRSIFEELKIIREEMKKHDPFMTEISFWVSRLFALTSTGISKIFIGQDKESECPGYTVGTNLWEGELPVLWELIHDGQLEDVHIYLHEKNTSGQFNWKGPLSLKEGKFDMPIWRRNYHPLDPQTMKLSFVEQHFDQKDYDHWRKQPPRRGIMLSKLKLFAAKWKKS